MSKRARERIARVESKRPAPPLGVTLATSGQDRSAAVVAWWLRMLGKYDPPAQG